MSDEVKLVYVSGPYTHGDRKQNVWNARQAGKLILYLGHDAFVPHYFHFLHEDDPHPYEFWMAVDLRMLARCDWFLRLPGYSPGADREHERAKVLGLRIFLDLEECLAALKRLEVGG